MNPQHHHHATLPVAGVAPHPTAASCVRSSAAVAAILGMALTSGCALLPAPAPVVAACPAPAPAPAPVVAPPAPAPAATRVVARPASVVRPVIPPLPPGVLAPARERSAKAKDGTTS